jgi:hypothetical protein
MTRKTSSLARTFAAPAAIAIASLVGLVAALLGDGLFDITSWLALATPSTTIAWALTRRAR